MFSDEFDNKDNILDDYDKLCAIYDEIETKSDNSLPETKFKTISETEFKYRRYLKSIEDKQSVRRYERTETKRNALLKKVSKTGYSHGHSLSTERKIISYELTRVPAHKEEKRYLERYDKETRTFVFKSNLVSIPGRLVRQPNVLGTIETEPWAKSETHNSRRNKNKKKYSNRKLRRLYKNLSEDTEILPTGRHPSHAKKITRYC